MEYHYYTYSVPLFIKGLRAVDHLLDRAHTYVQEKGIDEREILEARLAPDMFPFLKQVQVVTDNAKGASARLVGVEAPSFPDTEKSIQELKSRVQKTILFLETLLPQQFGDEAIEERKIVLPYFGGKHFVGDEYLKQYALPNFYFHYVTIYNILRMKGLLLGKADYMNGLPLKD